MKPERLTPQEEKAMRHIWDLGEATVKEVLAAYGEPRPPYTTVASVVKNLEGKGFLAARRIGPTYLYRPLVARTDYRRRCLGSMVKDYFDNSYKELVSSFAREQKISAAELKEILRLIENEDSGSERR